MIHTAAQKMGISCPGEISLTGFGNTLQMKIATEDQNPELQGKLAARLAVFRDPFNFHRVFRSCKDSTPHQFRLQKNGK